MLAHIVLAPLRPAGPPAAHPTAAAITATTPATTTASTATLAATAHGYIVAWVLAQLLVELPDAGEIRSVRARQRGCDQPAERQKRQKEAKGSARSTHRNLPHQGPTWSRDHDVLDVGHPNLP